MAYSLSTVIFRDISSPNFDDRWLEVEEEITVSYDYHPGSPGKLYGPMEDSYPPEPPYIEVTRAVNHAGEARVLTEHEIDGLYEDAEDQLEAASFSPWE